MPGSQVSPCSGGTDDGLPSQHRTKKHALTVGSDIFIAWRFTFPSDLSFVVDVGLSFLFSRWHVQDTTLNTPLRKSLAQVMYSVQEMRRIPHLTTENPALHLSSGKLETTY